MNEKSKAGRGRPHESEWSVLLHFFLHPLSLLSWQFCRLIVRSPLYDWANREERKATSRTWRSQVQEFMNAVMQASTAKSLWAFWTQCLIASGLRANQLRVQKYFITTFYRVVWCEKRNSKAETTVWYPRMRSCRVLSISIFLRFLWC